MKKRILISGSGGFIGSHFLSHILVNTDWEVVGIDSWRHKGISERILCSSHYHQHKQRVTIFTHDLNAPISSVLDHQIGHIDYIVNFASDSHVDRSITHPTPFVQNNVNIALNMLDYARSKNIDKFIQIGTDEVYGPTDETTAHPEWSCIKPSNPYSASKAAQEAIAISFWRTYNVPVILTNIMNTFGETQDKEKFVPLVIRKILNNDTITIHSDEHMLKSGSRYWLHARNTSDAILFILKKVDPHMYPNHDLPERFNIVGEQRISNLDIAVMIASIIEKPLCYVLVDSHSSRPGHDLHYGLSGEKLASYGYKFPVNLKESMEHTVKWTIANKEWLI